MDVADLKLQDGHPHGPRPSRRAAVHVEVRPSPRAAGDDPHDGRRERDRRQRTPAFANVRLLSSPKQTGAEVEVPSTHKRRRCWTGLQR